VIYLDDEIANHPKMLRAGAVVGGDNGRGCALSVYVGGLGYSRHHLTDGFVPTEYVKACGLVADPLSVATALVRAKLWHKCPRGFRIHDYHDHNKSSAKIKRDRQRWRDEKRRQRHAGNGRFSDKLRTASQSCGLSGHGHVSGGVSGQDSHRDSRARDPRTTDPRTTDKTISLRTVRVVSTDSGITARSARGIRTRKENEKKNPTHRILCSMIRAEMRSDPHGGFDNWIEGVKVRLARQGFAYPVGDALAAAFDAIDYADGRFKRRA
jgi:hypothetical protein